MGQEWKEGKSSLALRQEWQVLSTNEKKVGPGLEDMLMD